MPQDPKPYLKGKHFVLEEPFIHTLCTIIKEHIKAKYANDKVVLVTLAHDGMPPAHIVSRDLNIPVFVMNGPLDIQNIKGSFEHDTKLIMIDDIYDTGNTYELYKDVVHADEWIFLTAKQDIPEGTFCPCVLQTQAYIVYPWEKYDFTED